MGEDGPGGETGWDGIGKNGVSTEIVTALTSRRYLRLINRNPTPACALGRGFWVSLGRFDEKAHMD